MISKNNQSFTVHEIRDKVAQFCAYQDRCHWEVERKLMEFKLIPEAKDDIIIYLIQNNFLNEERFAKSFARGKFYQKNWGKIKITNELKLRKIPSKLIEIGLREIDANDYFSTLENLYKKKLITLSDERDSFKKKLKLRNYLTQKGYESHLIQEIIF